MDAQWSGAPVGGAQRAQLCFRLQRILSFSHPTNRPVVVVLDMVVWNCYVKKRSNDGKNEGRRRVFIISPCSPGKQGERESIYFRRTFLVALHVLRRAGPLKRRSMSSRGTPSGGPLAYLPGPPVPAASSTSPGVAASWTANGGVGVGVATPPLARSPSGAGVLVAGGMSLGTHSSPAVAQSSPLLPPSAQHQPHRYDDAERRQKELAASAAPPPKPSFMSRPSSSQANSATNTPRGTPSEPTGAATETAQQRRERVLQALQARTPVTIVGPTSPDSLRPLGSDHQHANDCSAQQGPHGAAPGLQQPPAYQTVFTSPGRGLSVGHSTSGSAGARPIPVSFGRGGATSSDNLSGSVGDGLEGSGYGSLPRSLSSRLAGGALPLQGGLPGLAPQPVPATASSRPGSSQQHQAPLQPAVGSTGGSAAAATGAGPQRFSHNPYAQQISRSPEGSGAVVFGVPSAPPSGGLPVASTGSSLPRSTSTGGQPSPSPTLGAAALATAAQPAQPTVIRSALIDAYNDG